MKTLRCMLFGRVASKNKGQPRKKTVDARGLAGRCDSSRLDDNVQQSVGVPRIVFVRSREA